MTISKPKPDVSVWMSGGYDHSDLELDSAVINERISTLTEMRVEFLGKLPRLDLSTMVGRNLSVHVSLATEGLDRKFTGTCVSVEALDTRDGNERYVAEVRPWLWMLTLTRNNRVFQNVSVVEIIEKVIGDHGFGANVEFALTTTYEPREYCVQYRESDFDFLSRLMEEEGLFYYFNHEDALEQNENLVICDSNARTGQLEGYNQIDYKPNAIDGGSRFEGMMTWTEGEAVVRGKVSLGDYQFTVPSVAQMAVSAEKRGEHPHTEYEHYDLPGHYRDNQGIGDRYSAVRLGADTAKHKEYEGVGTYRYMSAGHSFKMSEHRLDAYNTEYLVVAATHHLMGNERARLSSLAPVGGEDYSFKVVVIKKEDQFRAPMTTPWPEVPGVQTGVVVGPDGEEIYTDEHGRVKVHFRWDRKNPKDDTASCWIRVATGWSGSNWGLNSVPRIGQEVLIQFEDGDPDRPIVTGMLYNAETMPPYVDPAQPTRTGLMTRSSPGGGEKDFNAWVFEDKAGAEYMHVQAQKDYQMVVKDSAQVTIGNADVNVDPGGHSVGAGSLKRTVSGSITEDVLGGHKTETIHTGDWAQTLLKGNYSQLVEEGDYSQKVMEGDWEKVVDDGSMVLTVEKDLKEEVRSGNMSLDVKSGEISLTAATKITLQVGKSKLVMTQTGIEIGAPMSVEMKSPLTTVKGDTVMTVKGGFVMIN